MHVSRFLAIAVAAGGLVATSSAPALAKPPSRDGIFQQSTAAVSACTAATSGASVGRLQANGRGKSGAGGQYHIQHKLEKATPSTTYSVAAYDKSEVVSGVDPVTSEPTCTTGAPLYTTTVKSNSRGKGVKNVNVAVSADTDLVILFTDVAATPTAQALAAQLTLTTP